MMSFPEIKFLSAAVNIQKFYFAGIIFIPELFDFLCFWPNNSICNLFQEFYKFIGTWAFDFNKKIVVCSVPTAVGRFDNIFAC